MEQTASFDEELVVLPGFSVVTIRDCLRAPSKAFTTEEICYAHNAVKNALHVEGFNPDTAEIAFSDRRGSKYDMKLYVDFESDKNKISKEQDGRAYFIRGGRIIGKEYRGKTQWFE